MTGSIAIGMTPTFEMEIGMEGISPLSRRGFAGLFELNANDDFCNETITCPSEQQTTTSKASPQRHATDTRRRWQIICSERMSVNEEAVSDEDLLAVLLSYLNSTNSRDLAVQLIARFETFGNVVS